ncbi:hypothetical protein GCM10010106_49990 [Thermopolyspora flexuosa]|uniref:non-specific serine/threonine protein kinase n=1 Tax=Thermopolyspora flexuosa TaxID=103836 RepID=A0A543IXJ6_9ACTN|nr:serine/threonine-protein kinase [Thermopolyspora flexuosa]TQM75304.1 serine/threonine protein kinase [Thermopolyspora flexuosa]GGM95244.1 hypothetical protein GCM10010106_49990 [Thermopolyspora flexuosa]
MSGARIRPLGPFGPGAPGRTLLVLDHATGMQVAGKRLTPPADTPLERIRQEALALGGGHPSINPVFEVVADGGAVWVLSQAVPGRSLRAEVHRRGALGPAAAASIGLPVLAALTYAHERGIVHGNLHPGNVLLAADGRAWVTDFGIPSLAAETFGRLPGFTAPDAPSPAADLWSLGAVLYTAAMGTPPFVHATPAATAEAVREGIALEPADPFTALLRDLLAPDPARRPHPATILTVLQNTAGAPTHDVPTRAISDLPTDPVITSPGRPGARRVRLQSLVPGLAGAAVLGAAAALLVPADVLPRREPQEAVTTELAVGPFATLPGNACDLVPADLVSELVPEARTNPPSGVQNTRMCGWYSDYQVRDNARGRLSINLERDESEREAKRGFAYDRRLDARLVDEIRDVTGLGHEAFTFTRVTRSATREYRVGYRVRLSNVVITVEYGRSVGIDPDGSIAQGAERVTRAVIDGLRRHAE